MANRIHLDARQQQLLNTGRGLVILGASCLFVYLATGGASMASPAHAFLLFMLVLTGFTLISMSVVAPSFPRAARAAGHVACKLNHIFFGNPP